MSSTLSECFSMEVKWLPEIRPQPTIETRIFRLVITLFMNSRYAGDGVKAVLAKWRYVTQLSRTLRVEGGARFHAPGEPVALSVQDGFLAA
jgi:hypothetical protein